MEACLRAVWADSGVPDCLDDTDNARAVALFRATEAEYRPPAGNRVIPEGHRARVAALIDGAG